MICLSTNPQALEPMLQAPTIGTLSLQGLNDVLEDKNLDHPA